MTRTSKPRPKALAYAARGGERLRDVCYINGWKRLRTQFAVLRKRIESTSVLGYSILAWIVYDYKEKRIIPHLVDHGERILILRRRPFAVEHFPDEYNGLKYLETTTLDEHRTMQVEKALDGRAA